MSVWFAIRRSAAAHKLLLAIAVLAIVGVIAAGCGSGSSSSSGTSTSGSGGVYGGGSSGNAPASGAATVMTANSKLGTILVGQGGRTLYVFDKDTPNMSTCTGSCAAAWPPEVTNGTPKAGNMVNASMLGTTMRSDGTTQVTYNSHPLYYFSGDSQAGQMNGEGVNAFGAKWFVVAPSGNQVT